MLMEELNVVDAPSDGSYVAGVLVGVAVVLIIA